MPVSLPSRFIGAFIKSIWGTMQDRIIDVLLPLSAGVYSLAIRGTSARFWEIAAPWLWVLCALVVWHSINAARLLSKEITEEASSHRLSAILSPYGKQVELPKSEVLAYRYKIGGILAIVFLLCASCSYLVWRAAHGRGEKAEPTPAQLAEIKELDQLFVTKDEFSLRQMFDFHEMMSINISMVSDRIKHFEGTANTIFDAARYMSKREALIDYSIAGKHLVAHGGGYTYYTDSGDVALIVLPEKYSQEKSSSY